MDAIKPVFNLGGVYVSAPNVSLFQYDNGAFILYAHVTGKAHPVHAPIHLQDTDARLIWHFAPVYLGENYSIPLADRQLYYDFHNIHEKVADIVLNPGEFYLFQVER